MCVGICDVPRGTGSFFEWFHDSTKDPASVPRANSRRFDQKSQYLVGKSHVRHQRWQSASRRRSGREWCQQTPSTAAVALVIVAWHSHMAERDRWQARLAIRSYAGAMAGRLGSVLLFEHTLLESARFDQCRNRFSSLLYSTARPDAPREASPGEVRTTSGRTPPCDMCNGVPERP